MSRKQYGNRPVKASRDVTLGEFRTKAEWIAACEAAEDEWIARGQRPRRCHALSEYERRRDPRCHLPRAGPRSGIRGRGRLDRRDRGDR